ncbi:MAG: FliI/YscN family ATPase [Rhizomicrobium sp.]
MTMHPMQRWLAAVDPVLRTGRVCRVMPTYIEADGPAVALGTLCDVETRGAGQSGRICAEVVRVDRDSVILSALEDGRETFSGARVVARPGGGTVPVGPAFLGRAVDALGRPMDGKAPARAAERRLLHGPMVAPLERTSPDAILETGIRAIDGLLTLGRGQRVGVFAAAGVGKTSLMGQIARQTEADILIMCLVGERGREVEAIWNHGLDPAVRARATLVAATSDQPAAMRVRAAHYAMAQAEYWRGEGRHVLLLLDSVTRLAMAMREIGLAAGEPPTVRAYTPNVFAAIPKIVERSGALKSGGAITAIMTVLSESDDVDDPVSEMMKSLLDGHIVLSRALAECGQFPAIDVSRSVSRQAEGLVPRTQRRLALQVLEWLSLRESSRTLVEAGLYAKGSNESIDRAIERHPEIVRFLKQERDEQAALAATETALQLLAGGRS